MLTLYSREYCHLCHEMLAELDSLRGKRVFELQVWDVDADPKLEEQFGKLVPVLMHRDCELARYRLDAPALEAYLDSNQGTEV